MYLRPGMATSTASCPTSCRNTPLLRTTLVVAGPWSAGSAARSRASWPRASDRAPAADALQDPSTGARGIIGLQSDVVARPEPDRGTRARRRQRGVVDRQGRRYVAGAGGLFRAAGPSLRIRRSRRLVLSLLSCTLGWSKGSMPSTAPATAVATSQRKNSAPMSQGSRSSREMTGRPAAWQSPHALAVRARPRPFDVQIDEERGRRRRPRARPASSPSTGRRPVPSLPVLSARSCSSQAPSEPIAGEAGMSPCRGRRAPARRGPRRPRPGCSRPAAVRRTRRHGRRVSSSSFRSSPMRAAGTRPKYEAPSSGRRCRTG